MAYSSQKLEEEYVCTRRTIVQRAPIGEHFADLEDPRRTFLNDHPLINIITIALCAVIAGAESWTDIESFGKSKQEWLSRYLELENGIPSHETLAGYLHS